MITFGVTLVDFGLILHLHGITFTLEMLYSHVGDLIAFIEYKLEQEIEKNKRRQLKMLLFKLSLLKPMNANGYFSISKETLVSMLSVRYVKP